MDMFRIILSAFSFLCLITAGLMLWQSHTLPEHFPHGAAAWLNTWFGLFTNPISAAALLAGSFFLAAAAACISEMLIGLLFTLFSALISALCLFGFMGSHYPTVAEHAEKLFR